MLGILNFRNRYNISQLSNQYFGQCISLASFVHSWFKCLWDKFASFLLIHIKDRKNDNTIKFNDMILFDIVVDEKHDVFITIFDTHLLRILNQNTAEKL